MRKKIAAIILCVCLVALISGIGGIFNIKKIEIEFLDKTENQSASEAFAQLGISLQTSILNVNENKIKANIKSKNLDRSIEVVDVERIFPNKIKIKLRGRTPICYVKGAGNIYWIADKDFQTNLSSNSIDELSNNSYIMIKGIELNKDPSFNREEFVTIKDVFKVLNNYWSDHAIKTSIKEINVNDDHILFVPKAGDDVKLSVLVGEDKTKIKDDVVDFYNKYVETYYSA